MGSTCWGGSLHIPNYSYAQLTQNTSCRLASKGLRSHCTAPSHTLPCASVGSWIELLTSAVAGRIANIAIQRRYGDHVGIIRRIPAIRVIDLSILCHFCLSGAIASFVPVLGQLVVLDKHGDTACEADPAGKMDNGEWLKGI